MSFFDDDFLGDMFDFDGDGKTSIDEEFMAYMMFEEMQKQNQDEHPKTYESSSSPSPRAVQAAIDAIKADEVIQGTRELEPITFQEYRQIRSGYVNSIVAQILFCLFLCIFPIAVIYAAIASYDPTNQAAWFVTLVFIVAAGAALCFLIKFCAESISKDLALIRKYRESCKIPQDIPANNDIGKNV